MSNVSLNILSHMVGFAYRRTRRELAHTAYPAELAALLSRLGAELRPRAGGPSAERVQQGPPHAAALGLLLSALASPPGSRVTTMVESAGLCHDEIPDMASMVHACS